jgi:hypothetical protein
MDVSEPDWEESLGMECKAVDLDVDVLLAPEEGNSGQPVFVFDRIASAGPIFRREYACVGVEFGAGDFASHGARSNLHFGVVPQALVFARVTASHHVEFVVPFSKPHRRRHGDAALAKSHEADVVLTLNLAWDGHRDIVRALEVRDVENAGLAGVDGAKLFHSRNLRLSRRSRAKSR